MYPVGHKKSWSKYNEWRKLRKKKLSLKKVERILNTKDKILGESNIEVDFSKVMSMKTVSIAVPGSILGNAQSPELRTYLAGQIARAACIYNIDEVVVFNDMGDSPEEGMVFDKEKHKAWRSCLQLERILQYVECPQYLRKYLFSVHTDLQCAGVLCPLETPHHLRADDKDFPFREGVVTNKPTKNGKGSFVNVGFSKDIIVDKVLDPGTRVTVKILEKLEHKKKIRGVIVPPAMPKSELGIYWGYEVRLAKCLRSVLEECPYKGGYDLVLGTSDKGIHVDEVDIPNYQHCIIFFGGLQGLEIALESDETFNKDISEIFHFYLNTCPNQGSRTIRTEEAILISLTALCTKLNKTEKKS